MPIDPRIIKVGITVNEELRIFDKLAITAQGAKYASATQNETTIKIANLDKDTRDFLATEGTPLNRLKRRPRQRIFVEAGRESTGVGLTFLGDITIVNVSQPPDIWTTIKAVTGQWHKGNVLSTSESPISTLSSIAKKAAGSLDLSLIFEADDKQIANYGFSGAATKQIDHLAQLASTDVFVDDDNLIVKNANSPISGRSRIVSAETGMVGIPEFTDFGIKVKTFYDIDTRIGDEIEVISKIYPASNGKYIIYKLDFDISNRDIPFYYIIETRRAGGIFNR